MAGLIFNFLWEIVMNPSLGKSTYPQAAQGRPFLILFFSCL